MRKPSGTPAIDLNPVEDLLSDITSQILSLKSLPKLALTPVHTSIVANLAIAKAQIDTAEQQLTVMEGTAPTAFKIQEDGMLAIIRRYERVVDMYSTATGTFVTKASKAVESLVVVDDGGVSNSELLQLHDRIIDAQDQQLDSLSGLLGRHKIIGEAISTELDIQVLS